MSAATHKKLYVTKASGKRMVFLPGKLKQSLKRSGADEATGKEILDNILVDAYDGISTQEIYKKAFQQLRHHSRHLAARYKLKQAIMELGPTGYPFELFAGKVFEHLGYKIKTGVFVFGECVKHEMDIIGEKENTLVFGECKFHNRSGLKCDVKVPLYVHARFRDIENQYQKQPETNGKIHEGWVITNTHFSTDAIEYGNCAGLNLLGWDYPAGNALKNIIDSTGLHPLTCLTTLRKTEKQFFLDNKIVLSSQLMQHPGVLKQAGIDTKRIEHLAQEIEGLCHKK